jgi:hypothetical protein
LRSIMRPLPACRMGKSSSFGRLLTPVPGCSSSDFSSTRLSASVRRTHPEHRTPGCRSARFGEMGVSCSRTG